MLPIDPMAPITRDPLPQGPEWGYQLKWDGVRILAEVHDGEVELYSRKQLRRNTAYPELVRALSGLKGHFVLDGEAVVFDPAKQRPVFQRVLQRERMTSPGAIKRETSRSPALYVLFDLLEMEGEDLRGFPYTERHERLQELFPERTASMFVADLFQDGEALWAWVAANQWEGVVAKRLISTYKEGKKHNDWFKKKTALVLDVEIIGYSLRSEDVMASLLMISEGAYFGKVSLGLNVEQKRKLLAYGRAHKAERGPFAKLPAELRGVKPLWLDRTFTCRVTGTEITEGGFLRHPKLVSLPEVFR